MQGRQPPGPPAASLQGTSQVYKESVEPTGPMTGSVAARLSANLQVKGEITGSEDLVIEGTFEGLVQLNEGKLTIGTTAKVTADIMAAEVVVSGNVKETCARKTESRSRKMVR